MNKGSSQLFSLIAAPLLLSVSCPLQAAPGDTIGRDTAAYDEAIALSKSQMMANSSDALDAARKAKNLVTGKGETAAKDRLTAQWLEAEALMRLNRPDGAAVIIGTALAKIEQDFAGSKLHADLLRSKASLAVNGGKYGEALSSFLEAHTLFEKLGEDRSRAIVLQNIGSLYNDARDYERVLKYYGQARDAFPEDVALSLSSHNNVGNALKELDRLDDAEAEFNEALKLAQVMESPLLQARILTNIASTQFLNGRLQEAEQTIDKGLQIAMESAPEWQPFLYGVKAQIALERKDLSAARNFLERTFLNEDLTATSPFFRDFHQTAHEAYLQSGDFKLSNAHLAAFHRIDGQAMKLSSMANNALLAARFDAANRDLRIQKLSFEKEANEARLDSAQEKVLWLSAVIGLVVMAFLIALYLLRLVSRSRAEIKEANEKLTHVIQHDALTQLYARDHFRSLLEAAAETSERTRIPPVLAFIDLDRFKQVNDLFGHAVGDKLLVEVAERFRMAAGEGAAIGRLGGDEFAILMSTGKTMDDAVGLAELIIEQIAEPFHIEDNEISIGASIGLAAVTEVASPSFHMTNADLALYAAKDRGRGNCVVYHKLMRERLEDRSSLENDLEAALENGELSVCYQPIVRGSDGVTVCYEALMRWTHPDRGIVPPSIFIKAAEDSRMIERLGEWMLRHACSDAAKWPDDIKVAVNISALQITESAFVTTVAQALSNSGLKASKLVLELTENLVLEKDPEVERVLASLSELGVAFALDDFGRGYSSLNYVDQTNFTMIKIDRELVHSAAGGVARSQAVVAAIVALANSLDIEVAAGGVENADQAAAMVGLGCSRLQGFHYGRPAPASKLIDEDRERAA